MLWCLYAWVCVLDLWIFPISFSWTCMWVGWCFLPKPCLSLHPLPCATLITYSAVCRLIVAIVMLIRALHAENVEGKKNRSETCSNLQSPLPPTPISSSSLYPSILYVFYIRCNNQLIWKTLNYRTQSHLTHTHMHTHSLKVCSTKVLLKLAKPCFPGVFCLKKLVISFNRMSLWPEQWALQYFLSLFKSLCVSSTHADGKIKTARKGNGMKVEVTTGWREDEGRGWMR